MDPLLTLGDTTLLLLTVVLLRVLWFLPTIPLLGQGMPPMILAVINKCET